MSTTRRGLLYGAGSLLVLGRSSWARAQEAGAAPRPVAIPDENRADLEQPPPRPPPGDAPERAARLFEAILANEPDRASDFFFPRDAFSVLKGIRDPDRYWQVLYQHYERDIGALHAEIPAGATFARLEMTRRGGWVARREEANALPYWASRHDWIHYRVGERESRFEVRTLITWGTRWYITHLR
ncbi:MAG: hypothetical protein AB7S26_04250 [Sandaracinaceae bacterium]